MRFTSDYEKAFPSPCQALLHVSTSEVPASKWPVGQRERLTSLYSQWLEAYTWNMLHPHTDADHFALIGPDHFARRLIRRRFPKLNIIDILDEGAEPHIPLHNCSFSSDHCSRSSCSTLISIRTSSASAMSVRVSVSFIVRNVSGSMIPLVRKATDAEYDCFDAAAA